MTAYGTFRKSRDVCYLTAYEGEADISARQCAPSGPVSWLRSLPRRLWPCW
jgi:hypothetical protein